MWWSVMEVVVSGCDDNDGGVGQLTLWSVMEVLVN